MTNSQVYKKPEAFKYGWTAGFYDAKSDDGHRYWENIMRYGPRDDQNRLFIAGYRAGQRARVGTSPCHAEPVMRHFKTAA